MSNLIRKSLTGAVAAITLAGTIAATATPASAQWRRHGGWGGGRGGNVAAGVIGGLALGALAAGAYNRNYSYGAPVYVEPEYYPQTAYVDPGYVQACHREWRAVYDRYGQHVRDRLVRVCR